VLSFTTTIGASVSGSRASTGGHTWAGFPDGREVERLRQTR